MRTKYIEAKVEEDIDLKNQYRLDNLPNPIGIRDACKKNYVDNKINDPSVMKNDAHNDLIDEKLTNARFIQVVQSSQFDSRLTS